MPRGVTQFSRRAFTLIELLVVIAIIAILAAILFPVFAQARQAAQKTADLSNMKQVGIGMVMYMNDYDDVYAMLRNGVPNWGCTGYAIVNCEQVVNGAVALNPYVKNRQMWKSPNDSIPRDDCPSRGPNTPGGEISYSFTYYRANTDTSFGVSGWSSARADGTFAPGSGPSLSASSVGSSASTIIIYPYYASFSYWNGLQAYTIDGVRAVYEIEVWPNFNPGNYWCGPGEKIAIGAYSGMSNFVYADSHASSKKREQVMDRLWRTNATQAIATKARNFMHYDESFHK